MDIEPRAERAARAAKTRLGRIWHLNRHHLTAVCVAALAGAAIGAWLGAPGPGLVCAAAGGAIAPGVVRWLDAR